MLRGGVRTQFLVLVMAFAFGVGAFALWHSQSQRALKTSVAPAGPALSAPTRNVLARVKSPLTLRYYALLDTGNLPAGWKEFAGRVDQLLGAYELETASNITVVRFASITDPAQNQAAADGIKPFNLDKGAACYCGIAVVQDGRSETLAHLDPEWEQAVELDLTRAIARVITPPPAAPVSSETASNQAAASEQVAQIITNLSTVSLAEGNQILRDAALAEFKATVADGASQIQDAEQKAAAAETGSEAEKQAALKHMREVQANQTQKLKDIAARLQYQLDALQRLKSTNGPSGAQ